MKRHTGSSGFISTIIIIIVAIILLKFWLEIDVIEFLNSAKLQEWMSYVRRVVVVFWDVVLKPLVQIFTGDK